MIRGEKYFFFQLIPNRKGASIEYRIAKSFEDLYLRFGSAYLANFHSITKLNEVTLEHIRAIGCFLNSLIS